jgi:hypothetical protein
MSYPGNNSNNPINGEGAFVVGGVGGAIIMGPQGLTTDMILGNENPGANMGDTSGPNAVNPSGTPNGIRHATQGGFRSYNTRYRKR